MKRALQLPQLVVLREIPVCSAGKREPRWAWIIPWFKMELKVSWIRWTDFIEKGNGKERASQGRDAWRFAGFLLNFQLSADQHMYMKKLPETRDRITRKGERNHRIRIVLEPRNHTGKPHGSQGTGQNIRNGVVLVEGDN